MPVEDKYAHCEFPIPVRHKAKVPFEPRILVPTGFAERALLLRRLDGELDRFILKSQDYTDLLVEAWSANIHRSVSAEGNPLSADQVKRVVRQSLLPAPSATPAPPPAPMDWSRQEILNHVAFNAAPELWGMIWTPSGIRAMHQFMMEGAPPETTPGMWRTFRGAILSDEGEEVCITAPPESIEREMESLLGWRNERAGVLFPVVAATVFFHEFESIHPFADGNGRMGRVLFHNYLKTQGLPNAHLCLIEPELMGNLERYYRLLAWTDHSDSYLELVDFFTDAVLKSYRAAARRLSQKDLLSKNMDETAKRLLIRAKQRKEWFTISEAERWVDGRGHATVRRQLNTLVDEGALESGGRTKSKRYRFLDALRSVTLPDAGTSAVPTGSAKERIEEARRIASEQVGGNPSPTVPAHPGSGER